jgi:hypothetical protein
MDILDIVGASQSTALPPTSSQAKVMASTVSTASILLFMNVLNLCFSVLWFDGSVLALHGRSFQHVQFVFFGIQMTEAEPEPYTTQEGKNGDDSVVPNKERILRKRSECLSDGSSKSAHEKVDRHDHGLHVGRSFGIGVFEGH